MLQHLPVRLTPHWCCFWRETECQGLKLLISIKVAFKMLKQDNFLAYRLWIVEKVEVLSRTLVFVIILDIVKVKHIWVEYDSGLIVKKYSIRPIPHLIPDPVFAWKINILNDKIIASLYQSFYREIEAWSRLYFSSNLLLLLLFLCRGLIIYIISVLFCFNSPLIIRNRSLVTTSLNDW